MPNNKIKHTILCCITALIVLSSIEILGYFAMWLDSRSTDYLSNKNYFNIRAMLIGNTDPELRPRYLSLPYLGYIPYPEFQRHHIQQHNEDGYRGHKIPLGKTNM